MDDELREAQRRARETNDPQDWAIYRRLQLRAETPIATQEIYPYSQSTAQDDLNHLAKLVIDFIKERAKEYYPDKIAVLTMNTEFNAPNNFGYISPRAIYYTVGRYREATGFGGHYRVRAVFMRSGVILQLYGDPAILR